MGERIVKVRDRIKSLRRGAMVDLANSANEPAIPLSLQVVVECRDEAEQRAVFEQLTQAGYRCRVLTL